MGKKKKKKVDPIEVAAGGHVITYVVRQRTTARDLDRAQRVFARELQLTHGRMADVVETTVEAVDRKEVESWDVTTSPKEVKIDE